MPKSKPFDKPKAEALRQAGKTWDEVGAACGVTGETAHRHLDPVYREKRVASVKAAQNGERRPKPSPDKSDRSNHRAESVNKAEEARVLASIPPDTRTWQQKMLGDPPRWRSALGAKEEHNEHRERTRS